MHTQTLLFKFSLINSSIVFSILNGDSKKTTASSLAKISLYNFCLFFFGKKPTKLKREQSKPDIEIATVRLDAPGIATTFKSLF